MSRETLQWLNTNTLIGFTGKRGHAWHWRAQEQHGTFNHYPGPIPIADVQHRLFAWTADSRRVAVELPADPGLLQVRLTAGGTDLMPRRRRLGW